MSSSFTTRQQLVLAVAPKITSILSIIASTWIIVEVLTDRNKRTNVYHRLVLGLSVIDWIVLWWAFASTWPIPKETEDVMWAVGDQQLCAIQGIFLQIGIASPIYSTCLSLYFLLVIQFEMKEAQLLYNVEPGMHLLAISIGLLPAIAGYYLELYNNANLWCWIAPLPLDCEAAIPGSGIPCQRGHQFWLFRWVFYHGILCTCAFCAFVASCSTYWTVRQRELARLRKVGTRKSRTTKDRRHSFICSIHSDGGEEGGEDKTQSQPSLTAARLQQFIKAPQVGRSLEGVEGGGRNDDEIGNGQNGLPNKNQLTMNTFVSPRRQSILHNQEATLNEATEVAKVIACIQSSQQLNIQEIAISAGSRAVVNQALWYTGTFYLSYAFGILNRTSQQITGQDIFLLMFLEAFTAPLQGVFAFLVYRKSAYHRIRQQHPNLCWGDIVRRACRWTFLGPPKNDAFMVQDVPRDDAMDAFKLPRKIADLLRESTTSRKTYRTSTASLTRSSKPSSIRSSLRSSALLPAIFGPLFSFFEDVGDEDDDDDDDNPTDGPGWEQGPPKSYKSSRSASRSSTFGMENFDIDAIHAVDELLYSPDYVADFPNLLTADLTRLFSHGHDRHHHRRSRRRHNQQNRRLKLGSLFETDDEKDDYSVPAPFPIPVKEFGQQPQ